MDFEAEALWRVNEVRAKFNRVSTDIEEIGSAFSFIALRRVLEEFEAYKREVSKAVTGFAGPISPDDWNVLRRFILPTPVDPLEAALDAAGYIPDYYGMADFRQALAESGHGIAKIGEVVKP